MKSSHPVRHQQRGNPFLREKIHDPYRAGKKLREATRCAQCGVRYKNGRWTWPKTQTFALKSELCPACRRINDRYPAGEIVLSGEFFDGHNAEVLSRVRNVAESEQSEHPLHRIISIERRGADTVITTTDIHLPHRIGHALQNAWGGRLRTHYDREGYFTRVRWERTE